MPRWRTLLSCGLIFIALCSADPQNLELFAPGMLREEGEGFQEPVLWDGLSMG